MKKSNQTKTIAIIISIIYLFNACKQSQSITDKPRYDIDKYKRHVNKVMEDNPITLKYNIVLLNYLSQPDSLDSLKKALLGEFHAVEAMKPQLDTTPYNQSKEILLENYKGFFPDFKSSYDSIDVLQNKKRILQESLQNGYTLSLADSLLNEIVKQNATAKKKLSKDEVVAKFTDLYENSLTVKLKELIDSKHAEINLIRSSNAVMFRAKLFEANMRLNRELLVLYNNNFFEPGASTLTLEGNLKFKEIIHSYMATLNAILLELSKSKMVVKDEMVLKFYCDGFADWMGFDPGKANIYDCNASSQTQPLLKRKELNKCLSLMRATNILKLFIAEVKLHKLNIKLDYPSARGNGERYPSDLPRLVEQYIKNEIERPDTGDPRRRITVLQSMLEIKYEIAYMKNTK